MSILIRGLDMQGCTVCSYADCQMLEEQVIVKGGSAIGSSVLVSSMFWTSVSSVYHSLYLHGPSYIINSLTGVCNSVLLTCTVPVGCS